MITNPVQLLAFYVAVGGEHSGEGGGGDAKPW